MSLPLLGDVLPKLALSDGSARQHNSSNDARQHAGEWRALADGLLQRVPADRRFNVDVYPETVSVLRGLSSLA
jgi:hypothetical protein